MCGERGLVNRTQAAHSEAYRVVLSRPLILWMIFGCPTTTRNVQAHQQRGGTV